VDRREFIALRGGAGAWPIASAYLPALEECHWRNLMNDGARN
jgi:hypothetical protein